MGLTNIPKVRNYLQENTQQKLNKAKTNKPENVQTKKLIQGNNLQETGRNLRFQRENELRRGFLSLDSFKKKKTQPSVLVYLHLQINIYVLRFKKIYKILVPETVPEHNSYTKLVRNQILPPQIRKKVLLLVSEVPDRLWRGTGSWILR